MTGMSDATEFLSAVLIYSEDAERLARFYRDVLAVPLEEEKHGDGPLHYGCELGDVHFAIHPATDRLVPTVGGPRFRLAFTVFSTEALLERLARHGVSPVTGPTKTPFATFTAITDPDGNYVELTELSDAWFEHLAARRAAGADVVERWRTVRAIEIPEAEDTDRT
jgi:predicted enzyme related to lactoylglutathione lyase